MKVDILRKAEIDIEEAHHFYSQRSEAAAERFLNEYLHAVEQIWANPHRWPAVDESGHRSYRLNSFPFGVIYIINPDKTITIVSVFHLSREPGSWRQEH